MGMFNFVLDSIKGELFDFKVKRRVYVASTVYLYSYINPIFGKMDSPCPVNYKTVYEDLYVSLMVSKITFLTLSGLS